MKVNITPGAVEYPELQQKLQAKFPDYEFNMRGKSLLIGKKSNTCGANIMIRKKNINIGGSFPTMGGMMLFMASLILLGFLIPLIVYFSAFHGKMKAFEKELAAYLEEEYGSV